MAHYSREEFNEIVNEMVDYAILHKKRLNLQQAEELLTGMSTKLVSWNILYPKVENKNTRTHLIVEEAIKEQLSFEKDIRILQQLIKHGLAILNADDFAILRIHIDKDNTAIPDPTDILEISVVNLQKLIITIMLSLPKLPRVNYRSVFSRINDSAEILGAYTDATDLTPPDVLEYKILKNTKKSNTDLVFTNAEVGKRVWLLAILLNPKGDKGSVGVPVSVVVPG